LPSRCRRVSPRLTGNRLEPSDLADGLPLEPVDDADVDNWAQVERAAEGAAGREQRSSA
jgi:hypothetical protein